MKHSIGFMGTSEFCLNCIPQSPCKMNMFLDLVINISHMKNKRTIISRATILGMFCATTEQKIIAVKHFYVWNVLTQFLYQLLIIKPNRH